MSESRGTKLSRRSLLKYAGLGISAAYLAGCGGAAAPTAAPPKPASTTAPAAATSAPAAATKPAAVPTAAAVTPATTGAKVAVSMWWESKAAAEEDARNLQVADFNKKNPTIDLKRTLQADIDTALITAYGSGSGPDLAEANGYAHTKAVSDAGYVLALDDYYTGRKWPIFDWAKTWNKNGGKIWGIGQEAQLHGLYYNKTVLKKLGVEIPKTYKELQDACDKIKKTGIFPVNSDNTTATNFRRSLMCHIYALMTPKEVRDILFGDAPYDSPAMLEAVKQTTDWFTRGWVDAKLANTLGADPATPYFCSGKTAFWISGTYNAKRYKASLKDYPDCTWGYMDLPPIASHVKASSQAGTGANYYVNAKLKDNKDKLEATLKVSEYFFGMDNDYNKRNLEEFGYVPCMPFDYSQMKVDEDQKYLLDTLKNATDIGLQINKLWPGDMVKYENQAGMGLCLGEVKPEDFVKNLAKMWEENKKKNLRWMPDKA